MTACALLLSGTALIALISQHGPLMSTPVLGFAQAHDEISFRILKRASTPNAISAAAAEIHQALALSPYDDQARLRLVYIDALRHPPVGPEGVARLAESYSLIPYDYSVAAWRIRFGLEHWAALSPQLRTQIYAEAMAFGHGGHGKDAEIVQVLRSIHDPQGRLAAALWLQLLNP
jgi:hypothetical protein